MWGPLKRVNDAAADYTENLPWGDLTDLKPPITKALCPTTEFLMALIDDLDAMKLPRVPPHSLDMERGVKLLTGTKHMKSKNARRNFQAACCTPSFTRKKTQANHSVLNDIEQYRRNDWY